MYALDTVRAAVLSGEASLLGALTALNAALALAEADAPLEPGRADDVRVVNLNQAKGLEGHVVVLADPSGDRPRSPTQHVRRGDDGAALGYSRVSERGFGGLPGKTVALPAEWARWEGVERTFTAAEQVAAAGSPGYSFISVTSAAKRATPSVVATGPTGPKRAAQVDDSTFRGFSWGSAVHGALAVATGELGADELRAMCRSLLVEHGRSVDDHGDPVELAELIELVTAVKKSDLWLRAGRALRVYNEIPLAAREQADGGAAQLPSEKPAPRPRVHGALRQLDLFGLGDAMIDDAGAAAGDPVTGDPEGVIDLVFEEPGGWVVVDYKTDVGTDAMFEERLVGYRRQVDHYADAWGALTGDPVKERVLFFTTQDRMERW